jgi:hypothetical protein
MKPGDLIVVWGGTQPRATMYVDDDFCTEIAVARGTVGIVVDVAKVCGHKDGYIKVMLTSNQLGFIYKDAMRLLQ